MTNYRHFILNRGYTARQLVDTRQVAGSIPAATQPWGRITSNRYEHLGHNGAST